MEQSSALTGSEHPRTETSGISREDTPGKSDRPEEAAPAIQEESDCHPDAARAIVAATTVGESVKPFRLATLPVLKVPFAKDEPSAFWLRRNDQIFLAIFGFCAVSLLCYHWARLSRWGAEPIEIDRLPERRAEYRLNINRATKYEWSELDGIGPTLAERIIENRNQNGPFSSPDDLRRVRGIGSKTLEKLRPHLEVSGDSAEPARKLTRSKR